MKLNRSQQDFLSDKLDDFGNVVGTGSLLASFFTETVGVLPVVGGFIICIVFYFICLQLI